MPFIFYWVNNMSVVVNTNIASMRAQRSLASSGKDLQKAMERLVTGKRINSAADDPAGFAIAERMTSQIRALSMAAKNANDALGLLEVVENAANDVTDMLQRLRELAVQAKSGTNSTSDVANLQKEADSLMDEITRISKDTAFTGVKYIGTEAGTKLIQVGYNDGDTISITTNKVDSISSGLVIDADADSVNDGRNTSTSRVRLRWRLSRLLLIRYLDTRPHGVQVKTDLTIRFLI
jgi:flagellin